LPKTTQARETPSESGLSEHGSKRSSTFKRSRCRTRPTLSQVRELGAASGIPAWLRATWPTMTAGEGGKTGDFPRAVMGLLALGLRKAGDHAGAEKAQPSWVVAKDVQGGLGQCRHRRDQHPGPSWISRCFVTRCRGFVPESVFRYSRKTWRRPGAALLAHCLRAITLPCRSRQRYNRWQPGFSRF